MVLTRPSSISGKLVTSETWVTGMPWSLEQPGRAAGRDDLDAHVGQCPANSSTTGSC